MPAMGLRAVYRSETLPAPVYVAGRCLYARFFPYDTEEALWTDEYMNDRYSVSGKEHLFAQHQMLDFVETHSRRGDLRSNVARDRA